MKINLSPKYIKLILPYILVTTTAYTSRYIITDKLPFIRNYEKVNTKNVLILGNNPQEVTYFETKNLNQIRLYTKCLHSNNNYKLKGYLYTFGKYNEEELITAINNKDETYIKNTLGPPKEIEKEVKEQIETPYVEGIIFKNSPVPILIKETIPEAIINNTFIISASLVGTRMIGEVSYIIKESKEYKKTRKN